MLVPGSLSNGNWVESASLARAIETEMVAQGVLDLADETPEAVEQRRKTFVALGRAIVLHLTQHHQLVVAAGALGVEGAVGAQIPSAAKTLTGVLR
jgi:hypothetical protein